MRLLQWLNTITAITGTSSFSASPSKQVWRKDSRSPSSQLHQQDHENSTAFVSGPTDIATPSSTATEFLGATSAQFDIGWRGAWVSVEDVGIPYEGIWEHGLYDGLLEHLLFRIDRLPEGALAGRMVTKARSLDIHTSRGTAVRATFNLTDNQLYSADLVDLFQKIRSDFPARDLTARVILHGHEVAVLKFQHSNEHGDPWQPVVAPTLNTAEKSSATELSRAMPTHFHIGRHGITVDLKSIGAQSFDPVYRWYHAHVLQDLRAMTRADEFPPDITAGQMRFASNFPPFSQGGIQVRGTWNLNVPYQMRFGDLVAFFDIVCNHIPGRDLTARVYLHEETIALLHISHRIVLGLPDAKSKTLAPRADVAISTKARISSFAPRNQLHRFSIGQHGCNVWLSVLGQPRPGLDKAKIYQEILNEMKFQIPFSFSSTLSKMRKDFAEGDTGSDLNGWFIVDEPGIVLYSDLIMILENLKQIGYDSGPRDLIAQISYLNKALIARIVLRFRQKGSHGKSSLEGNDKAAMMVEKRKPVLTVSVPVSPHEITEIFIGEHGCNVWFQVLGEPRRDQMSAIDFREILDDIKFMLQPLEGPGTVGLTHSVFGEPRLPYHFAQDSHGNWHTVRDPMRLSGWVDVDKEGVVRYADIKSMLDETKRRFQPRDFTAHISYPGNVHVAKVILRFPHGNFGSSTNVRDNNATRMFDPSDFTSSLKSLRDDALDRKANRTASLRRRVDSSSTLQIVKHGFPSDLSFDFGLINHHLTAHATWLGRIAMPQSQQEAVWKGVLHFLNVDIKSQPTLRGFLNPSKIVLQYPQGMLRNTDVKAVAELVILMPWSLGFADIQALTTRLIDFSYRFGAQEVELRLLNARHHIVGTLRLEFETGLISADAPNLVSGTNPNNPYNITGTYIDH